MTLEHFAREFGLAEMEKQAYMLSKVSHSDRGTVVYTRVNADKSLP